MSDINLSNRARPLNRDWFSKRQAIFKKSSIVGSKRKRRGISAPCHTPRYRPCEKKESEKKNG